MRVALVLAFVAPAVALVYATDARACGYQCRAARAPHLVTFPASVAGISVRGEGGAPELEVWGPGDELLAGTYSEATAAFLPTAPLVPGEYRLKVRDDNCSLPPGDGGVRTLNTTFSVGPAAALPMGSSTLSIVGGGRATLTSPSSGACALDAEVAYVDLAFTPHPSLAPYASVLGFETFVHGFGRWSESSPGEKLQIDPKRSRQTLRLFKDCDPRPQNAPPRDLGLPPGDFTVEVRPLLPGSTTPVAAAMVSFHISCTSLGAPDGGPDDGGPPDARGLDTPDSGPVPIGDTATGDDGLVVRAGGGCTMHKAATPMSGVLLALGLLVGRRRR